MVCFGTAQAFFENRLKAVNAAKAGGVNPYPHKFQTSMQVPEYIAKYSSLENGAQLVDVEESLGGAWMLSR